MQFENFDKLSAEENYLTAKIALITSMSFLGVNYGIIFLLWFFMVSDTILGVGKVVKLGGWVSVTAPAFWAGILTKLAILFIPLSLALTGALVGYNLNIFVNTAMYILIANDAASCYTNLLSIKRGRSYENKDLVEMLINTLRTVIYEGAKAALNRLKNSDICDPKDEGENKS